MSLPFFPTKNLSKFHEIESYLASEFKWLKIGWHAAPVQSTFSKNGNSAPNFLFIFLHTYSKSFGS
jgi:hypothetical protein